MTILSGSVAVCLGVCTAVILCSVAGELKDQWIRRKKAKVKLK